MKAEENTKRCTGCYKKKPLTEFHKDSTRSDGLSLYCKPCKTARVQHSQEIKAEARARRAETNLQWFLTELPNYVSPLVLRLIEEAILRETDLQPNWSKLQPEDDWPDDVHEQMLRIEQMLNDQRPRTEG